MSSEQLSLFQEIGEDRKLKMNCCHYCNEDWSTKTDDKGIVQCFSLEVTKEELKDICRSAVKIDDPSQFGYNVFYEEAGTKKAVFVRFVNYTTRKKRSVFDHIDLYFDKIWEDRNKSGDA